MIHLSRPPMARCLALLALSGTVVATAGAASLRVTERSVDYPGSEGEMPAHVYSPDRGGRHPAVLVLHTSAGPGPNLQAFARRLAAAGFVTMTPDLFALHEFGPEGRHDHPLVLKDLDGALGFLKGQATVDPARVGVVGFSFGGRLAVIAAAKYPDLKAAVVYYAVASFQELSRERQVSPGPLRTRPLMELAPSMRVPVLIHHGESDRSVPTSQSLLLHGALEAAGKPSTLHLYPGADHLFNFSISTEGSGTHHPEADRQSWERTLGFLKRHLSP